MQVIGNIKLTLKGAVRISPFIGKKSPRRSLGIKYAVLLLN